MRGLVLAVTALVLAGCAGRAGVLPPRVVTVCPKLVQYDPDTQREVLMWLRAERNNQPSVARFIDDYGGLRNQVRACQAKARQ
jgi:hypothetical protein